MRVLAYLRIAEKHSHIIAMGDDAVEDYIEDAIKKYALIGLHVKTYTSDRKYEFEGKPFCGQEVHSRPEDKVFAYCSTIYTKHVQHADNGYKTFFSLLNKEPTISNERYSQFLLEMMRHPALPYWRGLLSHAPHLDDDVDIPITHTLEELFAMRDSYRK